MAKNVSNRKIRKTQRWARYLSRYSTLGIGDVDELRKDDEAFQNIRKRVVKFCKERLDKTGGRLPGHYKSFPRDAVLYGSRCWSYKGHEVRKVETT